MLDLMSVQHNDRMSTSLLNHPILCKVFFTFFIKLYGTITNFRGMVAEIKFERILGGNHKLIFPIFWGNQKVFCLLELK